LSHDGILVEEKGPALAVHYRKTVDPARMREVVLQELADIAKATGLTLFEGRMVVELRPPLPLGKGWSLAEIARSYGLASLVYIGDDRTDIEAFEALVEWREEAPSRHGVALAVASPEMPPALRLAADYLLDDVPAVELLLRQLAGMAV
jgi:trehalose 6-phosphate phosphatase